MASSRLLLALASLCSCAPSSSLAPPEFVVDLDLEPEDRFVEVVGHFNSSLWAFYKLHFEKPLVKKEIEHLSKKRGDEPEELQREIDGVARLTGAPKYGIHIMQMLYELNTLMMVPIVNMTLPWTGPACTGILALNKEDGMVYHARNMDFGPAEYIQKLLYIGIFKRQGKEIFRGQMIAGYSLPPTAMKKGRNGFTVELNTRFPDHRRGGDKEVWKNLFKERRPLNGWVVRKTLETAAGYEEAVHALSTTPYCTTEYTVIGGVRKGTILARHPDGVAHQMTLGQSNYQCREDYLIITNFDYWNHDDREKFDPSGGKGIGHPRRPAAQKILNASQALTPEVLYRTISDFEVQAKDTIFQAIMNVETGLWNVSMPACTKCGRSSEVVQEQPTLIV